MYKIKPTADGKFELWYQGENSLSLLGIYDSRDELDQDQDRIQKQEERYHFQSQPRKGGKRRKVVLRDPGLDDKKKKIIQIVVISDDPQQVGKLEAREIDLLISLGDLADFTVVQASQIYQPIQVLAVRGNHDDLGNLQKPILDLHLQVTEFKGLTFAGFNGCWRYKESGSYLYTQEQVKRMLNKFPAVDVFIAHNSPWRIHERDEDIHQGFQAFRDYIERVQPHYFLHGHQHVNQTTQIGATKVIGVYGELALELQLE